MSDLADRNKPPAARRQRNPLARALEILNLMVEAPERPWGVREIARAVGMHHSTTHHILTLLEGEGLLQQDSDSDQYTLGLALYRIAWRVTAGHPVRSVAQPLLEQLADGTGETALLGLFDAPSGRMLFAASIESSHPLRYVVETNTWLPVHAGATGLAILAYLPTEQQAGLLTRAAVGERFTRNTISDPAVLEAELAAIRARGYAITHSQRIDGAVGIAAPIFQGGSHVVGDVAITLPEQRWSPEREPELVRAVVAAASEVSYRLAGTVPAAGIEAESAVGRR
jgi:DNA-binding IclR family transcriptional regulator